MRVEKPKLNPMAEQAIAELSAGGVVPTPSDVLWLHELGERVVQASDATCIDDWLDLPRAVGNLRLYPLSIAAEYWIREKASPWFEGNNRLEVLAIAFALAHGRDPSRFGDMVSEQAAKKTLIAWQAEIGVSWGELVNAVEAMISGNTVEVKESKGVDSAPHWGFIIPWLCKHYGGTPRDWLYARSAEEVAALANALPALEGKKSDDPKFNRFCEFRATVEYLKKGAHPC